MAVLIGYCHSPIDLGRVKSANRAASGGTILVDWYRLMTPNPGDQYLHRGGR
jgi:hypothetical protein